MKDWTGNSRSYASTLGARNFALEEREKNDYYATDPKALEMFLERLDKDNIILNKNIWECACGEGHLSKVLVRGDTMFYQQTKLIEVMEKYKIF